MAVGHHLGERYRVDMNDQNLSLTLGPLETGLYVWEPADLTGPVMSPSVQVPAERVDSRDRKRQTPATTPVRPLVHGVRFEPVQTGAPFEMDMNALSDLSLSDDARVKHFGGYVTYETTMNMDAIRLKNGHTGAMAVLTWAKFTGQAPYSSTGKPMGRRYFGRHRYPLAQAVRDGVLTPGDNKITIRVATPLANRIRHLERTQQTVKRWTWWAPPVPTGLVGPVTLTP